MSEKTAFVIISFHKKFKNVYDNAIKPAIESCNLISLKANGEDKAIRDIYQDIAEKLSLAELVIVDISKVQDDDGNLISLDNVYYELGLSHGISKRVMFLTQDADKDIPYDLRKLDAITYDADDYQELQKKLKEKIPQALKDEPIKFFKDIEIKYKNKEIKVVQDENIEEKESIAFENSETEELLYALNDFFYNDKKLMPRIKLKLEKLKFIEIKYKAAMLDKPVKYIDITNEGAKFLEHNRIIKK